MKKKDVRKIPSSCYDFLIRNGMDETVAMEIDEYTQQKTKRKKRMDIKEKKEERWN
jgi:hypothetical protein